MKLEDRTEGIRRGMVVQVNAEVESDDKVAERKRLEEKYGQVWDTNELRCDFEVLGFAAPFVVVKNRVTGKKGSLEFQHGPRFYFGFQEA